MKASPLHPGQTDVFDRLPAGSAVNSETSEEAASALQESGRLGALRREVLLMFAAAGDEGLTADECVARHGDGTDTNAIAPRLVELRGMRYIVHHMEQRGNTIQHIRRKTRKGSAANVLVITPSGRKALTP